MNATFVAEDGKETPFLMGCYGIGITRVAAAAVEYHHDNFGIIWPEAIAPYTVFIVIANMKDEVQKNLGYKLYENLDKAGIEVLLDDRDERIGVKFKDADLIGIPYRVTVGKKAAHDIVEWKPRGHSEIREINASDLLPLLSTTREPNHTPESLHC